MALQIYCKTAKAVLILGCDAADGPMRFPSLSDELPGVDIDVHQGQPINEQLLKACLGHLRDESLLPHIDINQEWSEAFVLPNGVEATLYVARIDKTYFKAPDTWPTMPNILRGMAKNRLRLPYLKAWQVLLGALSQETKVIDIEEALRHLKSDPTNN